MRIAVLGAGMVGRTIAVDLSTRHIVDCYDASEKSLAALRARSSKVRGYRADLSKYDEYDTLLINYDLVVCAVPGFMGFNTLKAVIAAGKDVVDISFFPEDALVLDKIAKSKNVTAIVDCGVAPGLSNLILGHCDTLMKIHSFACYVGGLPVERKKPFEYKAPFSPIDVIEEYTRPARLREGGKIVVKPALSDIEKIDVPGVGKLEAFNTDGLRSLLITMRHIPNMKEKTLRYPGHAKYMEQLKSEGPLINIAPKLIEEWKLLPGEDEFTVMKIIVKGKGIVSTRMEYTLKDDYDRESDTTSMSRTTGYTCAAAVNMLATGLWNKKGVFPPEYLGADERCYEYIIRYLRERDVHINGRRTR